MKSTALLTLALFFAVAPSPDAKTMSEITAGFLKSDQSQEFSVSENNQTSQGVYFEQQASSGSIIQLPAKLGS
jgi:hypothetical protein